MNAITVRHTRAGLQAVVAVKGRALKRWALLAWHGGLASSTYYITRTAARRAKQFPDQQVVPVEIKLGRHRVQVGRAALSKTTGA
jgi:hypothetical protein